MSLSSILCSWIQLTERNKTWKFEENRPRKLNGTQPLKTMVPSLLFPSSRLIFSPKTMVPSPGYHYPFGIENLYHLLCAFSFYFLTKSIFFENMITSSTRSYWENLYHLLCAFSLYFSMNALRKPLSFTMCFLILFFRELDFLWKHAWVQLVLTEKISIIYYVLSHRVHSISRQAHCH